MLSPRIPPAGQVAAASVGLALSAVAVWALTQLVDVRAVRAVLEGVEPMIVGLAVISLGVSMALRTERWRSILPHGRSRPTTAQLFPLTVIGYAANALVPLRAGDAARGVLSARKFGLGVPETLGSVALERLLDVIALAALLLAVSIGTIGSGWLAELTLLIAGASAVVLLVFRVADSRQQLLPSQRFSIGQRFLRGWRPEAADVRRSLAWGLAAWATDGITFWACGVALGVEISPFGAMLIAGGAALASALPAGPAAVGAFELGGTAVALGLGVAAADAVALVVLGHAVTVIPVVVAGAVFVASSGLSARELFRHRRMAGDLTATAPEGAP